MNPLIQLKKATPPFLGMFVLVCLTLSPRAQAVVPPPDGGYPNFNTAEGQKALFSLTTGQWNTALGAFTLWKNTDGSFNTAVGTAALLFNIGNQSAGEGIENTAVGAAALLLNTTGSENTAVGVDALLNNTEGESNTANGAFALFSNTTGERNTATGDSALFGNTTGTINTATGNAALVSNTTGHRNTAIGGFALQRNNSDSNTAIGASALRDNTTGFQNTASGVDALANNTEGIANTANGANALSSNTTGTGNTAIGVIALVNNTTGFNNTAVGYNALRNVTTGSGNIALGDGAGSAITTNNDVICIGAPGPATVSGACFIGQIFGTTSSGGTAVFINSDGRLGTQVSSRRFKEEIKPMERSSEALYALKPVTFRYKQDIDPDRRRQFGLVAEDVEKVNPDLVVRDKDGKPYTVRYEQVNAMLLNEFLKEHCTVQELKSTVAKQEAAILQQKKDFQEIASQQQKQIETLTTGLQKVSAQLETSKFATGRIRRGGPAPQVVNNP